MTSCSSREPPVGSGSRLPAARQAFSRELERRLLLFAQELSGLARDDRSRGRLQESELVAGIDRLMREVAQLEAELRAARRLGDGEWAEARAGLESRWREFRSEFERLAVACAKSHAAGPELGGRGPRR